MATRLHVLMMVLLTLDPFRLGTRGQPFRVVIIGAFILQLAPSALLRLSAAVAVAVAIRRRISCA